MHDYGRSRWTCSSVHTDQGDTQWHSPRPVAEIMQSHEAKIQRGNKCWVWQPQNRNNIVWADADRERLSVYRLGREGTVKLNGFTIGTEVQEQGPLLITPSFCLIASNYAVYIYILTAPTASLASPFLQLCLTPSLYYSFILSCSLSPFRLLSRGGLWERKKKHFEPQLFPHPSPIKLLSNLPAIQLFLF